VERTGRESKNQKAKLQRKNQKGWFFGPQRGRGLSGGLVVRQHADGSGSALVYQYDPDGAGGDPPVDYTGFDYDAYGVALTPLPFDGLYYTGEMYDSSASMYYLRARWYDAATGRFNRMDPFAGNNQEPQSLHKYLYCHANPVNGLDPSGNMGFIGTALTVSMISGLICMTIAGIDTALDPTSTIDDIFFAMQVGLLIGVGAGLLAVLLGPAVMAAIAPYAAYLGLILGGIMTIDSFRNGNIAQGIFRLLVTLVSFGLTHPRVRGNVFKFVRGTWSRIFPKKPALKWYGNVGCHQKTAIYNPQTKQIIVGDGIHVDVYMQSGLDSSCSCVDELVGGFANFDDAGNLLSVEWVSGTFQGTAASRAEAEAAAAVFIASK